MAGAGAAWLALHGGEALARPDRAAPLRLRRGIDITPSGLRWPGSPHDYRVLRAQAWAAPLLARATTVRFWADWPILQPEPVALEDPANPALGYLAAFDQQIDAAIADGLEVIVMPYRYPRWVNHRRAWDMGVAPEYLLPDDGHGPYSAWATFVEALWRRYAGRMTYFDVVNEPNLQLRPQARIAERTAVMMATVDAIARRHDLAATCLAPSCSDADSHRVPDITKQPQFAAELLDALDATGFAGGDHWVWAFHNYGESESGGVRSQLLREQLTGRWRGRAAPDGAPLLYATEGGVRISYVARVLGPGASPQALREHQAALLADALRRAETTPGLGLYTQYTIHAEAHYDCGIRETDGAERPSFGVFVA